MLSILALGATETLLNRIIDLDAITRLKLNELDGQVLRVVIDAPNLSLDVFFDIDKIRLEPTPLGQAIKPSLFEQRPYEHQACFQAATATLHVADLITLFKLLMSKENALGNIPLQGDYHLLFTLKSILAQTELDLAAQLSPWIGATLAHELAKLQQLPKQFAKTWKSAEFMLTDTLKEDAGLFAARWKMQVIQQQTQQLQQNLERAEARTQRLIEQLNTH